MSKIAEQKALETYPEIEGSETYFDRDYICTKPIDLNKQRRQGYIKGYEQAMQDFLDKAEEFFNKELFTRFNGAEHRVASNKCMNLQQFIEQFKNYIQNESEK